MAIASDAPAIITQLGAQIVLCAAWTGAGLDASKLYYPEAANLASLGSSFTIATLALLSPRWEPFANGASPLEKGELGVLLQSTETVGVLETLGSALLRQLIAQQTGIIFQPGSCGMSSDPSPAKVAGGSPYRGITLHLPYGLNA